MSSPLVASMQRPRPRRGGVVAFCLPALLLLAASTERPPAEWSLTDLLEARAQVTAERARYSEVRDSALTRDPVRLEGTLEFRAPDYLRKTVTEPEPQELEARGDRVRIVDGDGRERTHPLSAHPALHGLVVAFRATLAGDPSPLEEHYDITFSGPPRNWTLELRPRHQELSDHVERVAMRGDGVHIRTVETRRADGERSRLEIDRHSIDDSSASAP